MKSAFCCSLLLVICLSLASQSTQEPQNIFIITTDGFRWQEVFSGADSALINNPLYVQDTSLVKAMYWDEDPVIRRRKLMPFFWDIVSEWWPSAHGISSPISLTRKEAKSR